MIALAAGVCAAAAAQAAPTISSSPIGAAQHASNSPGPPGACSFTQNKNFNLQTGWGCYVNDSTNDTQYLRIFDLDGEHGLSGQVCVESLDYGVDMAEGGVGVTFTVYCAPQGFADDCPGGSVDRDILDPGLVYSITIEHPNAGKEYFNQPLKGCCDADTQDMAVEIATEDCQETGNCHLFFAGANSDPTSDTKSWYIAAPDCGVEDPIDINLIARDHPLLMRVHVRCSDVPAVTGWGIASLLLLLGSGAAYVLRRQSRLSPKVDCPR